MAGSHAPLSTLPRSWAQKTERGGGVEPAKADDPLDIDWSGPLFLVVASAWRLGTVVTRGLSGFQSTRGDA